MYKKIPRNLEGKDISLTGRVISFPLGVLSTGGLMISVPIDAVATPINYFLKEENKSLIKESYYTTKVYFYMALYGRVPRNDEI